jgi:N-methylhydantoinase A
VTSAVADGRRYRIGVDTGGTFTDVVAFDERDGTERKAKVPSTPRDPAAAVLAGVAKLGIPLDEVGFFILGTTIATNCLLQRNGQRTVYLTTAGFEDVLYIQRIDRKGLHDLQWVKPRPYVLRRDCFGVGERVLYDGTVLRPLSSEDVARAVEFVRDRDAETEGGVAVAINLLFSYVDPSHEQQLAEALRRELPHVPVSLSSDVAPIWREYERGNTVAVDAYLRRLIGEFAGSLQEGLAGLGLRSRCFFLKSNGGQVEAEAVARKPVNLILSGLAGGLIAGKHFADVTQSPDVFTLDMGGTSADVGVIIGGLVRSRSHYEFEWGLPIAVPTVDLSTIGAGGSSIAGFDLGGLLKVGPESAGADPGPAAYGNGGTEATVTDANLVLGRLNPRYFLGGELELYPDLARAAIEPVAERLACSVEDAAQAIVELATENMASAVRLLAADRGLDYRRFGLVAFGGAGPLHASMIARRVGLTRVVVPPSPGLGSAFGALAADLRVDRQLTRMLRSDRATDDDLRDALRTVAEQALADLSEEGAIRRPAVALSVSCRYLGQNYEEEVPVDDADARELVAAVRARFDEAHERRYGYRIADAVVELVQVNAVAVEADPSPLATRATAAEAGRDKASGRTTRPVYFKETGWVAATIVRRSELRPGDRLEGPAIVEELDSTTLVLAGQVAEVHASSCILITETGESLRRAA